MAKKDKNKNTAAAGATVPPVGGVYGAYPPPGGVNSTGVYSTGMYPPPGGVNSTGVYSSTTTTYTSSGVVGAPAGAGIVGAGIVTPPPTTGKQKKEKKKKGKKNEPQQMQIDRSKLTPEQLAQLQLEEAIKESTDPSSRLKKLKSPLSVGGCLGMLAIFVVATVLIVFIVCWIMVDKFNPLTIAYDMLDKFGIIWFFRDVIGAWFANLFNGGGNSGGEEIIKAVLSFLF